jgi:hypothetical protein
MITFPPVDCRPAPAFADDPLDAVRRAFEGATPILLGQAWRSMPDPGFAPSAVRTAWRDTSLLVFAELEDADIFTRAVRHNDRFWELGDTFEIFLQPEGARSYVEFHVTPNNLRLQLRFDTPPSPGRASDPFEVALIRDDVFESRVWVDQAAGQWSVLARIPAAAVDPGSASLEGTTWRFSFSRYDYTRGCDTPVISSTSPHSEPRFHRPDEWRPLRFVPSSS